MNSSFPVRRLNSRARFTLIAAIAGMALAADAAASSRVRTATARTLAVGFVAEPLAATEIRPTERAFLTRASESVRQQMRLAEVGVSQSGNSEVRSAAHQMATDYRALNDALEALIRRKGGIAGAPVGGTSERYQKLVQTAGGNFDREFVRTVADASNQMLTMFEQVVSETRDPDIRELAASQLPVLRAHRTAITELTKSLD